MCNDSTTVFTYSSTATVIYGETVSGLDYPRQLWVWLKNPNEIIRRGVHGGNIVYVIKTVHSDHKLMLRPIQQKVWAH